MKKAVLIISAFIFLCAGNSKASHASGAETNFTCLGNGQFEVSYILYRDCYGIPAPLTRTVVVTNACGFPTSSFTVPLITVTPEIIPTPCPGQISSCLGGTAIGIEIYVYSTIITLTAECDQYTFGFSESSRNPSITTLVDPDASNLYVEASLMYRETFCNNSPVFSKDPVIIACLGQPICMDAGIYDPDGDSLVCTLLAPLASPNRPLIFESGYSTFQPIRSNPPVSFNPTTGIICMVPQQQQVGVIALWVMEYRNGELIGQVERDVQCYISSCNNTSPSLSGINGGNSFDMDVCAEDLACFTINSFDNEPTDSTFISLYGQIPGSSFSTTGAMRDGASFCWTTTDADTLQNPHCFDLMVNDNSCSYQGSRMYSYCINVLPRTTACLALSAGNYPANEFNINFYPQPAIDVLNIDFGKEMDQLSDHSLQIASATGSVVYSTSVNEQKLSIDTKLFSGGIYFVSLIDSGKRIQQRKRIVILK